MLSNEDRAHLASLEGKLQIVKDRTRGVAEGWATGLYLWGTGGIAKSWTVEEELERTETPWRKTNSRITGRGLFDLISDAPGIVHVLEDCEQLLRDPNAAGVLRSACWTTKQHSQHPERIITWRSFKTKLECRFTGGIILIQNGPIDDHPELKALKTRIAHLRLQPTPEEIIAKMRAIAHEGYKKGEWELTAKEALEICERAIEQWRTSEASNKTSPDIRHMVITFGEYLQCKAGHSKTDWRDLMESRLREQISTPLFPQVERREERVNRETEIAHEIAALPITRLEKEKLWKERTGKAPRSYYRRLEK